MEKLDDNFWDEIARENMEFYVGGVGQMLPVASGLVQEFLTDIDPAVDMKAFLEGTRTAFMRNRSGGCGFVTFKTLEDHVYYICGLGVSKYYRGSGYSRLLLGAFLQFVRQDDPHAIVRLGIDRRNHKARYLYCKFGFEGVRCGIEYGRAYEILELRL